jgi:uncharacterized 2Fe-2S/4Fe-4S cluster protein (DUF4445 family)
LPPETTYRILLQPIGVELTASAGTQLRDILFDQGVEFPCGGQGRCRGCRLRVVKGNFAVNDAQREHLSPAELADGWRLSCQCTVESDATIELRQWDVPVLVDDSSFSFTPRPGLGVAVDLGTTTLVAQLLDLETGRVLAVRTALNPQAHHGGDVMSRVEFSMTPPGQEHLQTLIRGAIGKLIHQLLHVAEKDGERIAAVALVGNTVMHHLFCSITLEPLSHTPFEPVDDGLQILTAEELGWDGIGEPEVRFLPCLGGFVGSDILAGLLATGVHLSEDLVALVDLGTNGEIVLGNREGLLCASTAAGPAFEGARISSGMRASSGAIWKVTGSDGRMECEVLGGVEPTGICGSGLVDAVAVGLDQQRIKPGGRLWNGEADMSICEPIRITQTDIRELQLAKGAIAAGIRLLLNRWGAGLGDVKRVYLAGAFGNYISRASAQRIGLLKFTKEQVAPVGNSALLGAKIALCMDGSHDPDFADLLGRVKHISLSEEPGFQDVYAEEMGFPAKHS